VETFAIRSRVRETKSCYYAQYFGNYLYVAGKDHSGQFAIYRYDVAKNSWETLPPSLESNIKIRCLCSIDDYIYAISESNLPQRYSLANNDWQKGAKFPMASDKFHSLITVVAVVFKS